MKRRRIYCEPMASEGDGYPALPMPGVHCLALSVEFVRVLTVARVAALGSAGVSRSRIARSVDPYAETPSPRS